MKEVPRHFLRRVRQVWGGGETGFHSFLIEFVGQFIKEFGCSYGAV